MPHNKTAIECSVVLQDIARYETVMLSAIQQPATCLHFLRPGRLVRIREGALDWGWGIVVSVMRKMVAVNAAVQADDLGPASAYILDLLLSCDAASIKGAVLPQWLCTNMTLNCTLGVVAGRASATHVLVRTAIRLPNLTYTEVQTTSSLPLGLEHGSAVSQPDTLAATPEASLQLCVCSM